MFLPLKSVYCSYGHRIRARCVVGIVSLSLLAVVAGQRMPPNNVRRLQMIQNRYPDDWKFLSHCLKPFGPGGLFNYELRQCDQNENPPFDRSSRVAIVGGGPSGIYMAKLLHDRGFQHLTLFEKEGRLGGKSKNLLINDGEKVDLGTIWTSNKYECVDLLAGAVNISERPIDPDGKTARLVSSPNASLADMYPPNFGNLYQWLADYAYRTYNVTPAEYRTTLTKDSQAYVGLWNKTMGSSEYMFPDKDTVNFDELNQSFLSWLENHGLYALIPRMIVTTSGAGYGNLETIPAYYGLIWNHPNFFGGNETNLSQLLEDFQTMFERILNTTTTIIKLNTQIVKIDREDEVVIEYIDESSPHGKDREHFDFLIMAAPMPTALKMLAMPTEEEVDLFGIYNYKSIRYDIGNLVSTGDVGRFNVFSWMDRHDKQTDYHVASLNEDRDTEAYVRTRDGIDGALTMARMGRIDAGIPFDEDGQFSPSAGILSISPIDTNVEDVRLLLKADLDEYNMTFSFLHTEIWPNYHPWKNLTQVVNEKMPWRIYDAQGKKRIFPKTWYVGSYVSFESVADVLDYNIKLVNEKLCVKSEDTNGKSGKRGKSGKKRGIFDL